MVHSFSELALDVDGPPNTPTGTAKAIAIMTLSTHAVFLNLNLAPP
jgi:hypothetical protein